jgi:hypothetical protein
VTPVRAHLPGAPATNGTRLGKPYVYRAPRPTWMVTALAHAQARYGPPVPTCPCGHRLTFVRNCAYGHCKACGWCAGADRGSP